MEGERLNDRAMKKAQAREKAKLQQVEMAERSIEELEAQKENLKKMVDARLKEYVKQKNGLTEIANREIEQFNVMYEEFEAICKNLHVTTEEVLTEGH